MDWTTFLEMVAIPAFCLLGGGLIWAYIDLRSSIRYVDKKAEDAADAANTAATTAKEEARKENEALRIQMQALTIDIMKQYVPKDDVLRLEERIIGAIAKLEAKIERLTSNKE